MDIESLFREIEGIDIERKRLQTEMRKLNDTRKGYIQNLIDAATEQGLESLSYKGKEYPVKEKIVRTRKPEKVKRKDVMETLSNYTDDAEEVCNEVLSSLKGEEKVVYDIKF